MTEDAIMKWEDYIERFKAFLVSMQQARLAAFTTSKVLSDPISNMPAEWRDSFARGGRGDIA
jgi:hypothetical protein